MHHTPAISILRQGEWGGGGGVRVDVGRVLELLAAVARLRCPLAASQVHQRQLALQIDELLGGIFESV